MIFFFIYLCFSEDNSINEFEKPTEGIIIEQMRRGKKFSEIFSDEVQQFTRNFPNSKELADIVDDLEFPYQSCYSEVVSRLNANCNTEDPDQQRALSIQFTKCYYNITNKLYEFPSTGSDEEILHDMSSEVYTIYTVMKQHLRNLCHFAKQTMFNEETSKQLVNLFKSVIDSSRTIEEMNHTMNVSFRSLTNSIITIGEQLQQGQFILNSIGNQTIRYEQSVKKMAEALKKPFEHIENVKMFFLMVIISFFISFFLPEILLPMLSITLIYFFSDKSLKNRFEWWETSYLRVFMKFIYFALCASYPVYKISSNFVTQSILKFFRIKKEETLKTPRFGYNQPKSKPKRPRAY